MKTSAHCHMAEGDRVEVKTHPHKSDDDAYSIGIGDSIDYGTVYIYIPNLDEFDRFISVLTDYRKSL